MPPGDDEEEPRMLLRFSTPCDPAEIADLITFNVLSTELQDWYRGYAAARRFAHREQHLLVPYEHRDPDTAFPLVQWIGEQRKAYKASKMPGQRARGTSARAGRWSCPVSVARSAAFG
jgi:hypothetical protein